jgi:archaellum biogenesis ATPase FlaH
MDNAEQEFEKVKAEALSQTVNDREYLPISLDELLLMNFLGSKWVVDKLVPHEGITIISGAPASFKTWLLICMAIDVASGGILLGQFQCQQANVLIIDEENHLRYLQDRIKLLGANKDLPIHFLSQKGFLVTKQPLVDKVLTVCEEKNISVIFIDSLVRVNDAEENDASQMSEVFRCIRQLCQNGKTVILTHHERKEGIMKSSSANRLRGSSDILAAVDAHISMRKDKDDKNKVLIEQAKLRNDKEIEPFEVAFRVSGGKAELCYLGLHSDDASKKESAKDVILVVLEEEKEGLSRSEICKRVKEIESIGDKSIKGAINELIQEKALLEKQGLKNTKICSLPKFQTGEITPQLDLV